jgi:hypothetical protein
LRQAKGKPQAGHTLVGKSAFLRIFMSKVPGKLRCCNRFDGPASGSGHLAPLCIA